MSEDKKTYEYLPEDYEQELLIKKYKGKKQRFPSSFEDLNINSLMDILTILLVFLLKSYSTDPLTIEPSSDLQIPKSSANLKPTAAISVTVSKSAIMVDNKPVLTIKDGKIESSQKRGGDDGYFIIPLNKELVDAAEKQRRLASVNTTIEFKGLLTIVMDEDTPYRLLTEIMYTAGQAEFSKFKFATVKGSED
jgi:biopolymer transport protein ExbD